MANITLFSLEKCIFKRNQWQKRDREALKTSMVLENTSEKTELAKNNRLLLQSISSTFGKVLNETK